MVELSFYLLEGLNPFKLWIAIIKPCGFGTCHLLPHFENRGAEAPRRLAKKQCYVLRLYYLDTVSNMQAPSHNTVTDYTAKKVGHAKLV